jgi:hypothetical protein
MKVSGQLHTPAALPSREGPQYPLDRKLCGSQSRFGEEKNLFSLPGIDPHFLGHPGRSVVAIPDTPASPLRDMAPLPGASISVPFNRRV